MEAAAIDPAAARAAGFTLLGEPLAVDLANTWKLARTPAVDLFVDDAIDAFWSLEAPRLPHGSARPDAASVRTLRAALRSVLDARIGGHAYDPAAVAEVNRAAAAVAAPERLVVDDGALHRETAWATDDDGRGILAAIARDAIDLVTGPDAERLRRCASPTCSMLFVAANRKRQWCTADGCGNRARVARHAARAGGAGA
ncbi:CGNR zinc finger domain-containing protein [Agromyces sp. MMS24-K17]|uniref:CGNR zinc finger domain-containing protein n=1 Tax=Agromyces sp. MMS24-K17 TaxID=3372850 RepID=UPI003754CD25